MRETLLGTMTTVKLICDLTLLREPGFNFRNLLNLKTGFKIKTANLVHAGA